MLDYTIEFLNFLRDLFVCLFIYLYNKIYFYDKCCNITVYENMIQFV